MIGFRLGDEEAAVMSGRKWRVEESSKLTERSFP